MDRRRNGRAPRRIVEQINERPQLRDAIVAACREEGRPLTTNAIHAWKNLKKGVPADRVMVVSRVLGIPPHKIRPDVFAAPK